jgi:hypothetical protein
MRDVNKFVEEFKPFFEKCRVIDSNLTDNELDKIRLRRSKGSFIAVAGKYYLNREYAGMPYQQYFDLCVLVDKKNVFIVPIVFLPNETRPDNFEHLYTDNTCCLGTTHELITIWGETQSAEIFFYNIIDVFLINLISFRESGKCATEDRPHGLEGLVDYYKDILTMSPEETIVALIHLYYKLRNKNTIKGHHECLCGKREIIRKCHPAIINFLSELDRNPNLKDAFLYDMRGHMEEMERKYGKTS